MPIDAFVDCLNGEMGLQAELSKVAHPVQLDLTLFIHTVDHGLTDPLVIE
jgi:hypothetical protein